MRKSRPQTALADFLQERAAKAVAGKQNLVSSGSGSSSLPARTNFTQLGTTSNASTIRCSFDLNGIV